VADTALTVVAVLNSSTDVLDLMREALQEEGFTVVVAQVPEIKRGREDLVAFLQQHEPAAIIYDIAPPYAENWNFLRLIRDMETARGRAFVLTTTNRRALEETVGPTDAREVIGKPYDLAEIVDAVRTALDQHQHPVS
jgi:CheY-like chemotaxis protein